MRTCGDAAVMFGKGFEALSEVKVLPDKAHLFRCAEPLGKCVRRFAVHVHPSSSELTFGFVRFNFHSATRDLFIEYNSMNGQWSHGYPLTFLDWPDADNGFSIYFEIDPETLSIYFRQSLSGEPMCLVTGLRNLHRMHFSVNISHHDKPLTITVD